MAISKAAGPLALAGHTVVVSGASGFIGRRLCAELKKLDCRVIGLMRSVVEGPWDKSISVDLGHQTPDGAQWEQAHAVFHLASKVHALAEHKADANEYHQINTQGTADMLAASVAAGARSFVYFSSVKAMGEGGDDCLSEDSPLAPETPYGISKREAEQRLFAAGAQHAMHVVALRPPLVYGPGGKGNLQALIRQMALHRFPPMNVPGNRRSMVHVDDLVAASLACAQSAAADGNAYIVTDGQVYSLNRIQHAIRSALGFSPTRWHLPLVFLRLAARLGDLLGWMAQRRMPLDSDRLQKLVGSACYNDDKLRRQIGFEPSQSLEQALPSMVAALNEEGLTETG